MLSKKFILKQRLLVTWGYFGSKLWQASTFEKHLIP